MSELEAFYGLKLTFPLVTATMTEVLRADNAAELSEALLSLKARVEKAQAAAEAFNSATRGNKNIKLDILPDGTVNL